MSRGCFQFIPHVAKHISDFKNLKASKIAAGWLLYFPKPHRMLFSFFFPLAVIWEHYWKVASVNKSASVLKALRGFELQRLLLKTQIYKNVNHKLLVRNDNNSVKGRRCVSALPSELDQRPKSTHLTCSDMQPVRLCGAYEGYVSLTLFSCNSQGFL